MNLKDKFTIFHTKLNLIGGLIASDNIPTACVEIGSLKQFALQSIDELEDEEPDDKDAFQAFSEDINQRKELVERLKKLEGFLNG